MTEPAYPQDDSNIVENRPLDDEEITPFTYQISSYGADYPVDALVQRIREGHVLVPPFQRKFVWTYNQASKFIESLLLGLPVPGIFLSKEEPSNRLLVIDGQQRLLTLQYFYQGIWQPTSREFSLHNVQRRFEGSTYGSLQPEDKRRLDDSILHATVIRQEQPSEDNSSVYYVFERLNTGGTQLLPQEIRSAIFHGEFNELLRTLNRNEAWRTVFGRPENKRMRDQELILRFFAFLYAGERYEEPLKIFLNKFMGSNRNLNRYSAAELTRVFEDTINSVRDHIGAQSIRPFGSLNAAVLDSVMVGIAKRKRTGPIQEPQRLTQAYANLSANTTFQTATLSSTASTASIANRLALATEAFAAVP